jgi:hypothetical protein
VTAAFSASKPAEPQKEVVMKRDVPSPAAAQVPWAVVRAGLLTVDLAAAPALVSGFAVVLVLGLSALAVAAGGVNFVLGLRLMSYFPVFPAAARILVGLSLLALAALLATGTLVLLRLARVAWQGYWEWHGAAWKGIAARPAAGQAPPRAPAKLRGMLKTLAASAVVFAALLAAGFGLMMALARGPFWHVWGWFA